MKKRFIILIDFSEYSVNLLKYAYDWSQQVESELLLVHQTTVLTPGFMDAESKMTLVHEANAEALNGLKALCRSVVNEFSKISYVVSEAHLQLTLSKVLAEPFDHLVFVGLKGTSLLKKIFIGSVAIQVIENATCAVVAMPKDVTKFSPGKIFVAVSEKHPFNILALDHLLKFMGNEIEHITFFYLAGPRENIVPMESQLGELAKFFVEKVNTSFTIYEGRNSFDDIKTVINNNVEEILVLQKGSRLLTDQIFRKFLINELVYEGQTPLVVLP